MTNLTKLESESAAFWAHLKAEELATKKRETFSRALVEAPEAPSGALAAALIREASHGEAVLRLSRLAMLGTLA